MQDLIMHTENDASHFDTKMFIAFAHRNISKIKNSNSTHILLKKQFNTILKLIHRKLII